MSEKGDKRGTISMKTSSLQGTKVAMKRIYAVEDI